MRTFNGLLIVFALCAGGISASGVFARCADLALVLAIDGSGSIDRYDFALQQEGYAAAFLEERVHQALARAGVVDVAVVLWGDEEMATEVLNWQRLSSPSDAERLSGQIAMMPRRVTGDTGIGRGIWEALDLLDGGESCALRRIINVSGDGRESFRSQDGSRRPLVLSRARAEAMGVTINGLAITTSAPDLANYYRDEVVTGRDAFVLSVASFDAFGEAITLKLVREIDLPMMAEIPGPTETVP
jgi:hypothetical protein